MGSEKKKKKVEYPLLFVDTMGTSNLLYYCFTTVIFDVNRKPDLTPTFDYNGRPLEDKCKTSCHLLWHNLILVWSVSTSWPQTCFNHLRQVQENYSSNMYIDWC